MIDPNVTKIVIQPYKDAKLNDKAGAEFTVPVNPETYAEKRQLKYDNKQGIGNQGNNPKFGVTGSEELKLEFILDGTGALEGNVYGDKSVPDQIILLLNAVYQMDGDIHKPYFLKVQWGKHLTFPSVLTSLDINYVLFKSDGTPLRAKVSANFLNYIEQEKRIRLEGKNSPDLTHVRTIVQGSRLDWMTFKFYGDVRHIMQVAKANGLPALRPLKTGDELEFPPFKRTET
jgi:phage tail protein X